MAIDNKKYEALHNKTGSDLEKIKKHFDDGDHNNLLDFPAESAIVYQMQKMQEELDYLRGLISNNRDKSTFPGFGTSNSTALRGDTTTISTSQASAITANTAKTGISTSQASAITANTSKVSFPFTGDTVWKGGSNSTATFTHNAKASALVVAVTIPQGPKGEPAITKSVTLTLS
tara:strand:+ start:654 stop:1178 length:525 start_codon:yes stop_codon:yes gene_type:complete